MVKVYLARTGEGRPFASLCLQVYVDLCSVIPEFRILLQSFDVCLEDLVGTRRKEWKGRECPSNPMHAYREVRWFVL